MTIQRTFRSTAIAICMSLAAGAANAALIVNGDFETGTLAGWNTFLTANGTIGSPAVVLFDTDGDSVQSRSARFNVGEQSIHSGIHAGGGIFQNIATAAGSLSISLDIASGFTNGDALTSNASGGRFSLLLDSAEVAAHDFASILAGDIERSTLSFSGVVTAGVHEVRVLMTRPFLTFGETPFQYLDDIVATQNVAAIPEPSTYALMVAGLGFVGFVANRRRKAHTTAA